MIKSRPMRWFSLYIFPLSLIWLYACSSGTASNADPKAKDISQERFKDHIRVLASDRFQGRMPMTAGESMTIRYLETVFRDYQLEPGNGGSYLQQVPLAEITSYPDTSMQVKGSGRTLSLSGFKDYVIWTQQTKSRVDCTNDELVFAGFGIVAPEYHWDDYKGIDVRDKIVVVLVNDPGFGSGDSSFFNGDAMTYYGRWPYKLEEAARHGAKGCLIIHSDAAAGYAFSNPQNNWKATRLSIDNKDRPENGCAVVGWISTPATQKLMQLAGYDLAAISAEARKPGFRSRSLHLSISTSMQVSVRYAVSQNVIAKITGTKRPNEYLIYSAHWDHVGIGRPDEKGDTIYNGAVDNASGVAGVLEIAHAFKSLPTAPERTVVFLFFTAEEQGLVGSEYYVKHPIIPLSETVANINLDALLTTAPMRDISVVGKGQSELEDYLNQEAEAAGRYVSAELNPAAGGYFRSDHYQFAKAGVPALFATHGYDAVAGGKVVGEKMDEDYIARRYHKPGDAYDSTWNVTGTLEDLQLLFNVGKRIAFEKSWPAWKKTSPFRNMRRKEE
jgi:Zn-dependent M28 family amino/carboxypeptidase